MFPTPLFRSVASSLIASWRSLVATDLLFKLFAFAVLTPLFAAFWHGLLAFGGSSVLSDADIAKFFAGPFGWFCGIVLGAAWLAIVAIEQASLLCILAAKSLGKRKERDVGNSFCDHARSQRVHRSGAFDRLDVADGVAVPVDRGRGLFCAAS